MGYAILIKILILLKSMTQNGSKLFSQKDNIFQIIAK